jgi:hypothetical protein
MGRNGDRCGLRSIVTRRSESTIATVEENHVNDVPAGLECRDLVRVPDGRIGEIVGFYRRPVEAVVVGFPSGASAEFDISEIRAVEGVSSGRRRGRSM